MGIVSERAGRVAVVRIDRPEVRNALDSASLADLEAELAALAGDEELGALVLSTTNVNAFCAGADVTEQLSEAEGVARMELFTRVYAALEAFPAPAVCVCVGDVVGAGTELAMACDIRVAGDNLKMSWVGAKLGVPVGPARLVPLVGLARAKELILLGRRVGAADALALGLASSAVAADGAEAEALALAGQMAGRAGARLHKQLLRAYEGTAARVARENDLLVEFQRHGAGLPRRS